eukprot:874719-Alexandrium_andersonii.AAC.1
MSFRAGTALQKELKACAQQQQGPLAGSSLPEPLCAAGNASMVRELRGGVLADRVPDLAGRGVAEYEGGRLKDGRSETGSTDAGECERAMPDARSESE